MAAWVGGVRCWGGQRGFMSVQVLARSPSSAEALAVGDVS